jgi:hypothetical protein
MRAGLTRGEEVWSKVWPSVLEKYRQQPGLHRVIMLRDVDDPRRYTLLVECDSRSHANAAVRAVGARWLARGLDLAVADIAHSYLQVLAESDAGRSQNS